VKYRPWAPNRRSGNLERGSPPEKKKDTLNQRKGEERIDTLDFWAHNRKRRDTGEAKTDYPLEDPQAQDV